MSTSEARKVYKTALIDELEGVLKVLLFVIQARKVYKTALIDELEGVLKVLLFVILCQLALRELLNAILSIMRTGSQWWSLPHDFPQWQSIYTYFRQWTQDGTW